MEVNIYDFPTDFIAQLVLQYPIKQIADFVRARHMNEAIVVKAEIEKVAREQAQVVREICNDMVKLMDYDDKLLLPEQEEVEQMKDKLTYINKRLKHTSEFLANRSPQEQRELFLPFLQEETDKLEKYEDYFFDKIDLKPIWELNDVTIHTYYRNYIDLLDAVTGSLRDKRTKDEIGRSLSQTSYLLFVYKPVIVAYMTNKLPNNVLLKRSAEIRMMLESPNMQFSEGKLKSLYDKLLAIPPIKDSDIND